MVRLNLYYLPLAWFFVFSCANNETVPSPQTGPQPQTNNDLTSLEIWKIVFLPISILIIIALTVFLKLHAFFALIIVSIIYGLGCTVGVPTVSIATVGFGKTVGNIGIIIVCGTIIGNCLLKSNGALVMAKMVLQLVGSSSLPTAVGLMGFVLSIAVFADSAFIILFPLVKTMIFQSCRDSVPSSSSTILALVMGLSASHTMIPPTPGPLAAALALEADLSLVIGFGFIISLFGFQMSLIYATLIGKKIFIWKDKFETNVEEGQDEDEKNLMEREGERNFYSPNIILCLVPILLPIVLIILQSVGSLPSKPLGNSIPYDIVQIIGSPTIALMLGAISSLFLLEKFEKRELSEAGIVGQSLKDCAGIILITGAGGAFGAVLEAADVGDIVGTNLAKTNLGIMIPVIVAAGIKIAQGSSTVAMITTASIIKPLLPSLNLDGEINKALLVIAIGGGSCIVAHVNDSLFWVVSQYAKISVSDMLPLQTVGTLFLGLFSSILAVVFSFNLIAGGVLCGCSVLVHIGIIIYIRCTSHQPDETESLLGKIEGGKFNRI